MSFNQSPGEKCDFCKSTIEKGFRHIAESFMFCARSCLTCSNIIHFGQQCSCGKGIM